MGEIKQVLWPADDGPPDVPQKDGGGPSETVDAISDESLNAGAIRLIVLLTITAAAAIGSVVTVMWQRGAERPPDWMTAVLVLMMFAAASTAALIGVRRRIAIARMFRAREDTEHEQVVIRVVFPVLILVYTASLALSSQASSALVAVALIVGTTNLISWLFLIHIMLRPGISMRRRTLGVLADLAPLTSALAIGGEQMSALYPIYYWITFGFGFRYGVKFLTLSSLVGLAGFALVLSVSEFWQDHVLVASGLLAAQIILPIYVSTLIRKLNRAISQAEEANRAKGRFLATVSHELRTPLTAIIGMGGLLRRTRVDEDQRDMIETVDTSAQSLLGLINEILDFSKIEAGKLTLDVDEFDIEEVCAKIWVMLRGQAQEKGLRLRISMEGDASRRVRGDAKRFTQVLINLAGNAIKFTESGTVELSVRLDRQEEGAPWFRFEVNDTGIGIAEEKCASVFEGFTQADDSIARRYGGTGLGLAISKQLVGLMGGKIGVDSELGTGSSFWLTIPFETVAAEFPERLDTKGLPVVLVGSDQEITDSRFLMMSKWQVEPVIVEHLETLRGMLADDGAMGSAVFVVTGRPGDPLSRAFEEYLSERNLDTDLTVIEVCGADALFDPSKPWPVKLSLDASEEEGSLRAALQAAMRIRKPWPSDAAMPAAGEQADHHGEQMPVQAARRILLAEDNGTNRMVITRVLEVAGHEVVPAADGDQALDLLANGEFDLALMDLNMPGTSGLDVVRLHRMSETDGRHLSIIALTADATEDAKRDCREAGMDDFLTKPVDPQLLFSMIDHWAPAITDEPSPEPVEGGDEETVTPISRHPRYQTIVEPVVDRASLDALKALDTDGSFFAEVLTEFLTDSKAILDEIEQARAAKDVSRFTDAAHSLRSAANHVGAMRVVSHLLGLRNVTAAELEEKGKAQVRELHKEFRQVRAALEQELHGSAASKQRR